MLLFARYIIFLFLFAQGATGFCMQNFAQLFSALLLSHELDNNKISHKDTALESLHIINKKDFPLLLKISPVPQKKETQQLNHGGMAHQLLATMHVPSSLKPLELIKGQLTEKVEPSSLSIQVREKVQLASEQKKRLIAGSAALGFLFVLVLCQKPNVSKFSNFKHFIANIIGTIRQERLRNYLRIALERSIEKSLVIGFIDIDELERILVRFNNNDPVVASVLNQQKIYSVFDTDIVYEGTLLGALFFEALINFHQEVLEIFFKYNINTAIEMTLRKNDQNDEWHPSLPLYIASTRLGDCDELSFEQFEKEYYYCIDLMMQHSILQEEMEKKLCIVCMSIAVEQAIKNTFRLSWHESRDQTMRLNHYKKNLKSLERLLIQASDNDSIWSAALRRHERWRPYDGASKKLLCEGSLLGMLFFKAVFTVDEKALRLFFQYDTHKKLGIYSGKNEVDTQDASLLVSCINIMSSKRDDYSDCLVPCLNLLLHNIELQHDDQLSDKQKKQLTQYIACALKKSIRYSVWVEKGAITISDKKTMDFNALEKILLLFNEYNPAITEILNQDDTCIMKHKNYNTRHDYEFYKGTILGTLFLQSVLTLNKDALQLFFKYGIHEKIGMNLFKNKESDRYLSLPACLINLGISGRTNESVIDHNQIISHKQLSCLELIMQHGMMQREDQIEEFIRYVIQLKDFKGVDWLKLQCVTMALQHGSTLNNVNSHYQGTNMVSFINSLPIRNKMLVPLLTDIFSRDIKQCILTIPESLNYYGDYELPTEDFINKCIIDCMRLLFSYGVPIKQEEITELLEKVFKEEIDFREKFLQFDQQENQYELFNNILKRSAEPTKWMELIIQSKLNKIIIASGELSLPIQYRKNKFDKQIVSINTLIPYCINHFHELISTNSSTENYIHYIESWADFIKLFFAKDNFLDRIVEKDKIKEDSQKTLGSSIVKILEYNYFNQRSDYENSIVLKEFLFFCLGKDNRKFDLTKKFSNLCQQGKLGNVFHIMARSGCYNKTMGEIFDIAKEKKQELSVLRALTQKFKHEFFNDEHTPLEIAKEETFATYKDKRFGEASLYKETISVMSNFIDHCRSMYKKSPYIGYSPIEDEVIKRITQAKSSLSSNFLGLCCDCL